jgi:hypothetical protein
VRRRRRRIHDGCCVLSSLGRSLGGKSNANEDMCELGNDWADGFFDGFSFLYNKCRYPALFDG